MLTLASRLDGTVPNRSLNLLNTSGRCSFPTGGARPRVESHENGWGGQGVTWPILAEPIHSQANMALASDVAGLTENWNTPGFFLGFIGPGTAFGEIGIQTKKAVTPFFMAGLLDGVLLKPSQERPLEEAMISFGDPQDGNWKKFGPEDQGTYFLEPDHPQARAFMRSLLQDLRKQGWRYIKIDFAYAVSDCRVKFDRSQTTFQSLRSQWRLFRAALGEDAFINACTGGIGRYTIGLVDLQRTAGDISAKPEVVRRNIHHITTRNLANGIWFQADPDVFHLRHSTLSFELSHLLAAYDRQHFALGVYNWEDHPRDAPGALGTVSQTQSQPTENTKGTKKKKFINANYR